MLPLAYGKDHNENLFRCIKNRKWLELQISLEMDREERRKLEEKLKEVMKDLEGLLKMWACVPVE